jgi:hypothetical protein
MNRLRFLLATGLALTLSNPSVATIRCGTDLVEEGDSVVQLLEACGEPEVGDSDVLLEYGFGEATYNFGPKEFMVRVHVMDGKVERTETLGYGFSESGDELQEE